MDPSVKLDVMRIGLQAKFSEPDMKSALMVTGDRVLLEAAERDPFWGCGCSMHSDRILHKANWKENQMGKLLMKIRSEMKQ